MPGIKDKKRGRNYVMPEELKLRLSEIGKKDMDQKRALREKTGFKPQNPLTDKKIIAAYATIVDLQDMSERKGYVQFKPLYQKLRETNRRLTRIHFREFMFEFLMRNSCDEFSFAHGSSIIKEHRTYGVATPEGLYYFLKKRTSGEEKRL